MWHLNIWILLAICGVVVAYFSFLYRERWKTEKDEFDLLLAEQVKLYPHSENIIWLDSPASILWGKSSSEVCVLCITNSHRSKRYGTFYLDTQNWRWRNSPPPGDKDLIKSIIADTLTNTNFFLTEEIHLEDSRKAPGAFPTPEQHHSFAKD